MSNLSSDLFQMRFRKSLKQDSDDLYSMNVEMRRLFLAIDETKIISQVASQQQMEFALVRDCIIELLKKGLIQPVGHLKLYVDHNFSKLLKINLHYILGRKEIAYTCVDEELKKMNLSHDQVPFDLIQDVVAAVSSMISDSKVRRKFCEYMKNVLPLRMRIKKMPGWDKKQKITNVHTATKGKTKQIIDRIIAERSGGNPTIEKNIKIKLILKGINPDKYSGNTLDNPKTITLLHKMADAMGVDLSVTKGKTKQIIDRIVAIRSGGDPAIENDIKTKLILKGINPDKYSGNTLDDLKTIRRLHKMADAMGVDLSVTKGKTKQIIDRIVAMRSGGDPAIENDIITKLMLKGINPDKYSGNTLDDPKIIALLREMSDAMGVNLTDTRGKTKQIIDRIIAVRSGGDPAIENDIKTKLVLKGINPYKYSSGTLDDPIIIARLHKMATAMGVNLTDTRGKAKHIIDKIIAVRSGGDPTIENDIKTKLIFKGINPNKYSSDTLDDPIIIARLCNMANAMGVDLNPQSMFRAVGEYS